MSHLLLSKNYVKKVKKYLVPPWIFGQLLKKTFNGYYTFPTLFRRCVLGETSIVIVATAHKVGSTWLYDMLRDIGTYANGLNFIPEEFQNINGLLLIDPEVFEYLKMLRGYFIFKSHSDPLSVEFAINNSKIITMYRDPRDVLISNIFYLSFLDEDKGGQGDGFSRLSETERILKLISKGDYILTKLENWFRTPFAYKVSYEDLKIHPIDTLLKISKYLEISTTNNAVERVVMKHSFEAKSGRKPGQEKKDSFFRKGVVGDWRNYFNKECVIAYKNEKERRWNRLLVEMGYESSLDWD
ncbi:sulfotransferase domain-containing protein [Chloroflexota bacterium]